MCFRLQMELLNIYEVFTIFILSLVESTFDLFLYILKLCFRSRCISTVFLWIENYNLYENVSLTSINIDYSCRETVHNT